MGLLLGALDYEKGLFVSLEEECLAKLELRPILLLQFVSLFLFFYSIFIIGLLI